MKRVFSLIAVLIVLMLSSGCNVKRVSREQSRYNFDYYKKQIQKVLEPYGLTLQEAETDIDETGLYASYLTTVDDTVTITVNLSSNATKDEKGREEFEAIYNNPDSDKPVDLKLFTQIANAVSGREISEEYCEQFLSAPEEEYSPSRYGIHKSETQKVYKYEFLNFGEDWSIGYSLNYDETEELTFGGLTKYGLQDSHSQVNNNDWSYRLPDDYEICHVNSKKIICVKRKDKYSASSIIDKYVVKFCYNDQYVCLQCVGSGNDINENISEYNLEFYIIDTKEDNVLGSYTEEEYLSQVSDRNIVNLSSWIPTKPRPEGAVFY